MKGQRDLKISSERLLSLALGSSCPSKPSHSLGSCFSVSGFEATGEVILTGCLKDCRIVRDRLRKTLHTVKVLPKASLVSKESTRKRIQRAMDFDCPNILKVVSFLEDSSNFYIFYEYISGDDLISEMFQEDLLSEGKCLDYFYGMCRGLDFLHSHNFVLRHLSLENIYFAIDRTTKIAIEFEDQSVDNDYIPPEAGEASFESNIWCLGLIFYEMVHGYYPENPSTVNRNLPVFTADLLSKLLKRNPLKRIRSRQVIVHSYFNKKLEQSVIIDRIEKRIHRSIRRNRNSHSKCYQDKNSHSENVHTISKTT